MPETITFLLTKDVHVVICCVGGVGSYPTSDTMLYMLCSISFNVAQLLQYTRLNISSVHRLFVLDIM